MYKDNSKPFQDYTGCTDWIKRNMLIRQMDNIAVPFPVIVKRGENYGFLYKVKSNDGRIVADVIKEFEAAGAGKEEIDMFLLSLKPIENPNFMSTSIGKSIKQFESMLIEYNIFVPMGTKGVFLEDLVKRQFLHKYEAELLLQPGQKLLFKNISFKDGKCLIDADIVL
jgi:hypothetical protein